MATVSKLQIVLEATTTAFDNGLKKATATLQGFAKKTDDIHSKMDRFARRNQEALDGLQTAGQAAAVGLGVIAMGIKSTVTEAMRFEDAMADVKKVIDFDTPEGIKEFRHELENLSGQLPIAFDGLAKIAAAAGQSGIAKNEILGFTKTAAKMATAFDITADEAGRAMAEMRVAFKMSQTDVETLADKINYLGNTTPNTAAKIMEVVQRIGSLGGLAGVSADQIAALAGSITAVEPDVVATGLKNMMVNLAKSENATTNQIKAFEKLGLSAKDISKRLQEDGMGTLLDIIERIKELPKDLQVSVIDSLWGSEALPVASQLVANYDNLKTNVQAVGDATKYAGSMNAEYEARAATLSNSLAILQNKVQNAKAAVGEAFAPAVSQAVEAISPVIDKIANWTKENPKLVTTITAITAGVLGITVALGGLALGFVTITTVIGTLTAITSLAAAPVVALVAALYTLTAVGIAIAMNWDTIKAKAEKVWFAIGEIVAIAVENVKTKFNEMWLAIGEIVAIAVENVSHEWQSFKDSILTKIDEIKQGAVTKFNELKASIATVFGSLPAPIQAGLSVVGTLFGTRFAMIRNIASTAFNAIKALVRGDMQGVATAIRTGLTQASNIVRTMISNIVGAFKALDGQLLQAGRDAIQGFINGLRQKMSEALNIARDMANSVASTVKSALNIQSPSRVMRELGAWAGEGFVLGVGDKVKDAKQVANDLANALTSTLQDLHRQNFMLLNHANPLADLEYKLQFGELAELTDKQKERLRELAKINLDIQKANKDTTKALQEQEQAVQNIANANERSVQNYQSLQKQIALFGNNSKVAEFDYDVKHGKYDGVSDENLANERSALVQLEQMDTANKAKTAFVSLQTSLAGELSPLAKLQKELDDRLQIIKDFENAHTGVELEAQQARQQAEQAYLTAKNNLMLNNYQNVFNGISGLTKSFFGEQSGIYRAMFAMEKGFAIAKAIIALKANIAEASKIGFPQNIPMIAGAVSQGVAIVNDIRSIAMPVGQAHDGIMSVPKSGTWNLEKGERVLPKHTAKALDAKLDGMGSGTKVIINNYTSEKASVEKQDNGDIMVTIGMMREIARAESQKLMRDERKQGGLLYGA